MSTPATRGRQRGRIARLLDVDAAEVTGLDDIPEADLAILHDQISNALFADGRAQFASVASLSKLLPGAVAGKLAEKFLPAVLAARVAELLEPSRARDLVNRVSVRYLGELALVLDPVRSKPVVQASRHLASARSPANSSSVASTRPWRSSSARSPSMRFSLRSAQRRRTTCSPSSRCSNGTTTSTTSSPTCPPSRSPSIVAELSPVELADLALALDPSRFGPIVHAVPVETVEAIAAELFGRGEYAGMAAFVGVVTPDMLHAALGVATGHDLIAVVPLLEWNDNLDHVIATAELTQLDSVFEAMIAEDLWDQGSAFIDQLGPTTQQHLLTRVGELSASNFAAIEAAAASGKLSATSRRLVDAAAQRRLEAG